MMYARVFREADSKDFVIIAFVVLIRSQSACDERTDRRTPLP